MRSTIFLATLLLQSAWAATPQVREERQFFDSHLHLTNYVQEGISVQSLLKLMGDRVGRSTLFGIPLQQSWSYRVSGKQAPTYYLESDSPLYYYSFTDAWIAKEYLSLDTKDRARFDPMITGFNPADMYAADHIRRVLQTFPGVFSGIGEFTIHKEFVSSKVAGDVASLTDPALDRILDFAAEAGLLALIHNDVQTPFPKDKEKSLYYDQIFDLFRRHPETTIIWAHIGLGRVIQPLRNFSAFVERILKDPKMKHVHFDISWSELAKYLNATPESSQTAARLINLYPDRFLFGTDEVAPKIEEDFFKIFDLYAPLWSKLSPETSEKVRKGNYLRLFDEARRKVRAWEAAHLSKAATRASR
jgi:predicted TIM-barrel fold metal-dependent hydrolase